MPNGTNHLKARINETTDLGIRQVGNLFLNLEFIPRLVDEDIYDDDSLIGNIDLVVEYEKHYFVVEVSRQRQDRNEKILAWFQKWSNARFMELIREKCGIRNTQKPVRVYVDLSRSSSNPGINPIPPNLRDSAQGNGILFKDDIEYFADIFSKVRVFARYDLLGFLDVNPPKASLPIDGTIQFYMKDLYALSFVISADDLLKSAYVFRRRRPGGYQRFLNLRRIADIEKKILNGRILSFPNSVLINMDREVRVEPRKRPEECPAPCVLEFPSEYCSSRIIDGQHRLMGIARLPQEMRENIFLQVIAFSQLDKTKEIETFVEINNNQSKVDRNLVLDLVGDFDWPANSKEGFQKQAVLVARELHQRRVLKIFFGAADEEREGKVYVASLVTGLLSNNLVGGQYIWRGREYHETSSIFIQIRSPQTRFSNKWRSFLLSNRGVRIVLRLMYLAERNRRANTIQLTNVQFIARVREIATPQLYDELTELFGLGGVRLAVQKIVERLQARFPGIFRQFDMDLRALRRQQPLSTNNSGMN